MPTYFDINIASALQKKLHTLQFLNLCIKSQNKAYTVKRDRKTEREMTTSMNEKSQMRHLFEGNNIKLSKFNDKKTFKIANNCRKCTLSQAMQDVDEFVSSLAHQRILCSE